MDMVRRVGTVLGTAAIALVSALPASAQTYPPPTQPPGPGAGAGGAGAGAGAAGAGAGAGAGGIAFTGADILIALVVLAGLIVVGTAALVAGRRRSRATA
jgi:hypothetical protein